jgi:ArsR family transcriptional regulator, arsenate/arsenite/antimonite-responsive transcriptional repressor
MFTMTDRSDCPPGDGGLCCPPLTESALDESQAEELATLFKALADPVRLRLMSFLTSEPGREICACDLPELLDRSQPTVSHHLGQLVKAGLLEREQRGKWAWFTARPERLAEICTVLGSASSAATR